MQVPEVATFSAPIPLRDEERYGAVHPCVLMHVQPDARRPEDFRFDIGLQVPHSNRFGVACVGTDYSTPSEGRGARLFIRDVFGIGLTLSVDALTAAEQFWDEYGINARYEDWRRSRGANIVGFVSVASELDVLMGKHATTAQNLVVAGLRTIVAYEFAERNYNPTWGDFPNRV